MSQIIKKDSGGSALGTIKEIVPNVGPDVFPDGLGLVAIGGGANITTDGTLPNTLEIRVSGTTDNAVQIGNATGSLTSLAVGTDGQVLLGDTAGQPAFATLTSTNQTIDFTTGANSLALDVNPSLQITTGFESWGGAGAYFDDTTLGDFELLRPGTGYINTVPVSWTAPQTVSGMTAGNTYFIYIDSTGTIGKTAVFSDALFTDNIVLFECLRDSTLVNNQITVKENHPYEMPVETSLYAHKVIGTVIENNNGGANITLNGTQKIQINGDDVFSDHGLYTDIPDSAGVAVSFRKMYTNAGGKWATDNVSDTFTGRYNNAGTPTALGGSKFGVYRLYCSKDSLNVTTPSYFAILHTAQFNTLVQANTAIGNGSIAQVSGELAHLELAQLGYIVYSEASASIVNVVIEKATLKQTVSTSGTNVASLVTTVTTNFDGILSAADTNVQAALETIDEFGKNLTDHALVIGNGNGQPLGVIAVGATGQTIMGATGADPAWTGSPSFSGTVTAGTGVTATTGNITASAGNVLLPTTTSTTGQLQINSTRFLHNYGTQNTFVGSGAGNFTLSGAYSAFVGTGAGASISSGGINVGVGQYALNACTTGGSNTSIGTASGDIFTTGASNTMLGAYAGHQLTGSDSSNILIGSQGTAGDNHKMRLGTSGSGAGQVNATYIAGITGVAVGGAANVTLVDANGKFGTTAAGTVTLATGTNQLDISADAAATTVNLATGSGAKVVTLGSTDTTSSLALKYGTSDFTLASATGTVISALDTGEVTMPLQPAFFAYNSVTDTNVTGAAANVDIVFNTEIFDQNSDYNNGTGVFTAPVSGRYFFNTAIVVLEISAAMTLMQAFFITSNGNRNFATGDIASMREKSFNSNSVSGSIFCDMDAGDTCFVRIGISNGAGNTADIYGDAGQSTWFCGHLVC